MTTDKTPATLATAKHGGSVQLRQEQYSDLVPGVVRCAKCAFQLHRTNLYLQSGTVGAGDSKSEPCPNGCGPLWPVTWETWAREGWAEAERLHLEMAALSAQSSPGGQDALAMVGANLRSIVRLCRPEDYSISRLDAANIHMEAHHALQLLEAALAARQPVCATVKDSLTVGGRQAVREVVEYQSFHGYGGGQWSTCDKKLYDNGKAFEAKYGAGQMSLYRALVVGDAAPPAQAVDLGKIIEQIAQQWDGCNYDAVGETIDVGRAIRAAGKRLIDSQAVGNG